ncbi:MAG TPA: SAM hydroxide adenosyltransferase, partial [Candidatus Binataceae bacterium]|nr:SAM hydroxide adenosyltransferase [Candidatus Binataceae bacterium]
IAISRLGPALSQIKELSLPMPQLGAETVSGEIIYVDAFGNLVTNIDRDTLARFQTRFNGRELLVSVEGSAAMRIFKTYGDAPSGTPLATFGSFDLLEIAVRDASATEHFSRREGARVFVKPKRRSDWNIHE